MVTINKGLYRGDVTVLAHTLPIFIHIPKTGGRYLLKTIKSKYKINYSVHAPSFYIKRHRQNYSNRFSFAIVRNPYERFLSACGHARIKVPADIEKVSNSIVNGDVNWASRYDILHYEHFFTQKHFIVDLDSEEVLVDFIGKYEDFKSTINTLKQNNLDISDIFELKENKSNDWKNVLTEQTKRNIEIIYKEDFEQFNYKMV